MTKFARFEIGPQPIAKNPAVLLPLVPGRMNYSVNMSDRHNIQLVPASKGGEVVRVPIYELKLPAEFSSISVSWPSLLAAVSDLTQAIRMAASPHSEDAEITFTLAADSFSVSTSSLFIGAAVAI